MPPVFSHFGICVCDLEASLRFYCEALGFVPAESHQIGTEFARLMELDEVSLRSQFIRREEVAIELLAFAEPAPVGEPVRRPVNRLGLTHLSFRVDDLEGTAARVAAFRGDRARTDPDRPRHLGHGARLRLLHGPRRGPDRTDGPGRLSGF